MGAAAEGMANEHGQGEGGDGCCRLSQKKEGERGEVLVGGTGGAGGEQREGEASGGFCEEIDCAEDGKESELGAQMLAGAPGGRREEPGAQDKDSPEAEDNGGMLCREGRGRGKFESAAAWNEGDEGETGEFGGDEGKGDGGAFGHE